MNNNIEEIIEKVVKEVFPNMEVPEISISQAPEEFGDFSSNVAMILTGQVGQSSEEVAQKIVEKIGDNELFEKVEVAKPGFINFKMALPFWQKKISQILESKTNYGNCDINKDKKIDIEFISANPTGPLTVGNSRGGVIGDTLANVLEKTGALVTREYYFNDAGGQIDILGHSVLGDDKAEYKGDYIDKLNKEIKTTDYKEAGKQAAQILISEIKKTVEKMGIKFDVWFAEGKDLRDKGKVSDVVSFLKEKDLAYEKEGALWFCSTKFGDDKDRVIIKKDGEPTYFCVDAAYHRNKFDQRKFDKAIDIWGADHHGDVARVKGFVKALGYEDKLEIILHQFVRVVADGKEVRMSKRAGNFIAVDDLLKEVGKDAYRFFMLSYDPNSHLTFDLKLAKERSQKNPVYYVQYAYARIHSILAKIRNSPSGKEFEIRKNNEGLEPLKEPAEIKLIKELARLPEIISEVAQDNQVQKLPFYATELANSFHHFYEECPILKADEDIKNARLELIRATQTVLKITLDLMGVSAPERM